MTTVQTMPLRQGPQRNGRQRPWVRWIGHGGLFAARGHHRLAQRPARMKEER